MVLQIQAGKLHLLVGQIELKIDRDVCLHDSSEVGVYIARLCTSMGLVYYLDVKAFPQFGSNI